MSYLIVGLMYLGIGWYFPILIYQKVKEKMGFKYTGGFMNPKVEERIGLFVIMGGVTAVLLVLATVCLSAEWAYGIALVYGLWSGLNFFLLD